MKRSLSINELTQRNVEAVAAMQQAAQTNRTVGERVADLVAATVGSWPFLIIQSAILLGWMFLNIVAWISHWDPYPFILLNLVLSFQAAYASPIIMMSQNRQAQLNERRNQLDLQINLLAEQETTEMLRLLRLLCEKMDIRVVSKESEVAFEQDTSPEEVLNQIDVATGPKKDAPSA